MDQIGLHLLEHRSRNALCSYEYDSVLSYSPAVNCLMIITGSEKKQSKVILSTSQVRIGNSVEKWSGEGLKPSLCGESLITRIVWLLFFFL